MSEKDVMFKHYAEDNHRFADLVNYLVFKSKPVVKHDQLKTVNIEEALILKSKDAQEDITADSQVSNIQNRPVKSQNKSKDTLSVYCRKEKDIGKTL